MEEFDNNDYHGDVFSKAVRAGKRTYFFDVRSTRNNDYYLIICESKRKSPEGTERPLFEKHKLFLYKEDFEKFVEGLQEAIDHIKVNYPDAGNNYRDYNRRSDDINRGSSDLEFDDLGK